MDTSGCSQAHGILKKNIVTKLIVLGHIAKCKINKINKLLEIKQEIIARVVGMGWYCMDIRPDSGPTVLELLF